MTIKTHIYTNPAGLQHDTGPGHPEQIARQETILTLFDEEPFSELPLFECRETDTAPLLYAHPQSYIDKIADLIPDSDYVDLAGEVIMSPGTWDAALSAANAVCRAVDDVISGTCKHAFCAVRPPGHHALPEGPMGFCLFGNIFIGARHAQEQHNIKRIAIIDFDVHHGNGTDYMARQAENIFVVTSQQFPLWPGTGDPKHDEAGKTLNIPLPPGAGSNEFRKAYEDIAFPALEDFKPELIMISAGFDAHKDDPLAQLNFIEDDYFWVTEKLGAIADKHCGGKIIAALEGGYNLEALKASVAAHIRALANI